MRLGHLGDYYETDMYTMISALDGTMYDLKLSKTMGAGVEALLQHFRND